MFREIRFQTGEVHEVAQAMKTGEIPHLEVNLIDEFDLFAERLKEYGIYKVNVLSYDKNARDKVKEPEFEFRAAFSAKPGDDRSEGTGAAEGTGSADLDGLMYLDVYFEEELDETYDPVGEM